MQISLTTVLLLAASAVALPSPQATEESSPQTTEVSQSDPLDALQDLTNQAISALQEQEDGQDVSKRSNQCSIFSAFVRKDWFVYHSLPYAPMCTNQCCVAGSFCLRRREPTTSMPSFACSRSPPRLTLHLLPVPVLDMTTSLPFILTKPSASMALYENDESPT